MIFYSHSDLTGDPTLLSTMFSEKSMGNFGFEANSYTFDFNPDFWDVMGKAQEILENNEQYETYFVDVLDQLHVDFEQLTGSWLQYNEQVTPPKWDINFNALQE